MKKRALRVLLASLLALAILSTSGFAVAFATPAGVSPNDPECGSTRLQWIPLGASGTWTNPPTGTFDQRLVVVLQQARDKVDNVYCDEMRTQATLTYRAVDKATELNAVIQNGLNLNQVEFDLKEPVANPSTTIYKVSIATTPVLVIACGRATGEWIDLNVIDKSVTVPTQGYRCAP